MQDSLVYKEKYFVIGKGVMHYIRLKLGRYSPLNIRKIFLWTKEDECLAFKEKNIVALITTPTRTRQENIFYKR